MKAKIKLSLAVRLMLMLLTFTVVAEEKEPRWIGFSPLPVPEGARVTLELDKPEWFLGENILVHFCLENTGNKPFRISVGGDYRGASRALSFKVTVTGSDGKLLADPDPMGFCMGGILSAPEIPPGGSFYTSLPLNRYCVFEKPGTYTIKVRHGLGWKDDGERKIPVGETTIKLLMPTPEQARGIVEEMERMPKNDGGTQGQKHPPYPDFTALHYPFYLPILLEHAKRGSKDAVTGIGSIATTNATLALIQLLNHETPAMADLAVQTMNARLPDPELDGVLPRVSPFKSPWEEQRREMAAKSWRPEFAPAARTHARKLLAADDMRSRVYGAFILQCVGKQEDFLEVIRVLDVELEKSKETRRDDPYLSAPGACRELQRAARMIIIHGAKNDTEPKSPAEIAVFLDELGSRDDFRPKGWENKCAAWLSHELPYLRQLTVKSIPNPIPNLITGRLPELLNDTDLGVRSCACDMAGISKLPTLREPVLKVLAAANEEWLVRCAFNAARELDAYVEALAAVADHLIEAYVKTPPNPASVDLIMMQNVTWHAIKPPVVKPPLDPFQFLREVVSDMPGYGIKEHPSNEEARALKARWKQFLKEHYDDLKAGKRFKIGDPALSPDLFPKTFQFHPRGGPPWPQR